MHIMPYPIRCRLLFAAVMLLAPAARAQQASNLAALHRSGQTFLTWDEAGTGNTTESYRVYRHTAEITGGNLPEAQRIVAVPRGSSLYELESTRAGSNVYFVIEDLGAPLASNRGLFVYTAPDTGMYYYAVTLLTNGWENTGDFSAANSLAAGIAEEAADPAPVLVRTNRGACRVYTQFMDYHHWNPTFYGYAFNYSVTVPPGYTNASAWPMVLRLPAYGNRYDEPTSPKWVSSIEVVCDDPKPPPPRDNLGPTWHYGFSATWNYEASTAYPTSGPVVNFTELRHLRALYDILRDPYYNVDTNRVYVWGESMGGSGALALGLRYPNVFAGAWCWQPMTDYRNISTWFWRDFARKWGTNGVNLAIENRGRWAEHLAEFNGLGVYDWMNHLESLTNRLAGRETAFLFAHHGTNDGTIPWPDQGEPAARALQAGRRGFIAMTDESTHQGMKNNEERAAGNTNWCIADMQFRKDHSFPAFSAASGNGPPTLGNSTSFFNRTLEWSCPWNNFAGAIVDTLTNYEIVVRSVAGNQHASITLRRPQAFKPAPGQGIVWQNIPLGGANPVAMGDLRVDSHGLVTVPRFVISTNGNRLTLRTDDLADTLGDGVPDWWLEAWGLDPSVPENGADADNDLDGMTNIEEYRAGTNPRDAKSAVLATILEGGAPGWFSTPGRSYILEQSTNLAGWAVTHTGVVAVETRMAIDPALLTNSHRAAFRVWLE